ncbi:MAG TPA: DNRLRE domain-containing protein, partial [Tepidisphaeraceae bacterium]|nr:DNRLRE domain-containing protein [Tepidisphaeraceae bacterium]
MNIRTILGIGRSRSARTRRRNIKQNIFELQPLEKRVLLSTTTLNPIADAFVQDGGSANANNGPSVDLLAKTGATNSGANRHTYLRFDLAALSAVDSATLRLYGSYYDGAQENVNVNVYEARNNTWTEMGITWNLMEPISAKTAELDEETVSSSVPGWYTFNVTGLVAAKKAAGDTSVSLEVRAPNWSNRLPRFNSREATSNKPELVVVANEPAVPTNLAASAVSSSQVNLSWTDASSNETGFKVQRSTSSSFPAGSGTVTLATTAAGATSYSDTGLSPAMTYHYRV